MTRNFAFTAVSVGSRLLVGLLLFLLLARLWGPETFGLFAFVFSICALLTLTVDYGFTVYLMRELPANRGLEGRIFHDSLQAKSALCFLLCAMAVAVALLLGPEVLPTTLFVVLLATALSTSFADFYVAPLRATGRYQRESVVVSSGNAVQFALAGGVAWGGGSPLQVAFAMLVARTLLLLVARWASRPVVTAKLLEGHSLGVRRTLQRAWPYAADGVLTTVWNFVDVVAVKLLFGAAAAGIYTGGQKIVQGVASLAPIVGNVLIPRISRQAAEHSPQVWRSVVLSAAMLLAIGVVFATPLVVAPLHLTRFVLGPGYEPLAVLLPWFGAVLFFRFLGAAFGLSLTAFGQQRRRLVGQIVGLLCFALGLVLVVLLDASLLGVLHSLTVATVVISISHLIMFVRFVLPVRRSTSPMVEAPVDHSVDH